MTPTTTRNRPPAGSARPPRAPINPRVAARRTAVTRQQGRRRLRVLVALCIGTSVLVGAWYLVHSSLFSARVVTVVGATHETAAQVISAAGLSARPPLVTISAGAAAARVTRLPWVRSASVAVHWPDGVRITVAEEVPAFAMSGSAGTWVEMSAEGRVLARSAVRPPGLLQVSGPVLPGAPGTALSRRDRAALDVASTLPASFAAQVTDVVEEPGGWVQLAMTTPILVDVGLPVQLPAKYEDITSLLAGATLHTGDVIDVSVPDAPTVTRG